MKKERRNSLDLNQPTPRSSSSAGPDLHNLQAIKAQLLAEIIELESQLKKVQISNEAISISLIQTYREMIHSRRQFFYQLSQ